MAGNYVEILVKSRDEAKPDLEDLKARLEELKHEVARARVEVDDGGDAAKLDRIQAKLIDIGHRTAKPEIKVSGALRAEAEIHAVEASLDRMKEKEAAAAAETAVLGPAMSGLGAAASEGGSALASLGSATIPLLAAAAAALLPEIVALASGFAAAGAGAGAFYVLAHPAINNLQQDVQALSKANQALGYAQQKYLIDPTKANAKALQNAQDTYQAIFKQMGQDAGPAAAGVLKLHDAFVKLSNAFQPTAFRVFADGLKVISNVLPALLPMAQAFGNAFDGLLKELGKFTASAGFQNWLKQFTSLIGPAVTAIGHGIAGVVNELGKMMTIFSGKDVARGITIAFDIIKGAIKGVILLVEGLRIAWDKISQTDTFRRIANDFKTAWDQISQIGKKKPDFSAITKALKDAVSTGVSWLSTKMGPLVQGALKAASAWLSKNASTVLFPIGVSIMKGLISGMESQLPQLLGFLGKVALFIAEHKGPIEKDRLLLRPHGRAMIQGLMDGMQDMFPDLRALTSGVGGMIGGEMRAGGGPGGGALQLQVMPGGASAFEQFMVTAMRNYVRVRGGNVQQAFGH